MNIVTEVMLCVVLGLIGLWLIIRAVRAITPWAKRNGENIGLVAWLVVMLCGAGFFILLIGTSINMALDRKIERVSMDYYSKNIDIHHRHQICVDNADAIRRSGSYRQATTSIVIQNEREIKKLREKAGMPDDLRFEFITTNSWPSSFGSSGRGS